MSEARTESSLRLGSECSNFQPLPIWHPGRGSVRGIMKVQASGYPGKRGQVTLGSDDSWSKQHMLHHIKRTAILPHTIAASPLGEGQDECLADEELRRQEDFPGLTNKEIATILSKEQTVTIHNQYHEPIRFISLESFTPEHLHRYMGMKDLNGNNIPIILSIRELEGDREYQLVQRSYPEKIIFGDLLPSDANG